MIYLDSLKYLFSLREIKIIMIIILALIVNNLANVFIFIIFRNRFTDKISQGKENKIMTAFSFIKSVKSLFVFIIVLMIVLSMYKIKITSILTGLGIVGVLVGLSGQALISDIISGVSIILDRIYYIGDRVKIGEIEGEVVDITLRRTYIKDDNGYIHSFPNSYIKVVSKKINNT